MPGCASKPQISVALGTHHNPAKRSEEQFWRLEGFIIAVFGLASGDYVGRRNLDKQLLVNTFHLELAQKRSCLRLFNADINC